MTSLRVHKNDASSPYSSVFFLAHWIKISQVSQLGARISALEDHRTEGQGVRTSQMLAPVNTSTPAPKARSNLTLVSSEENHSTTTRFWADRPVEEVPDYDKVIKWPDEDDEAGDTKLFPVSEETEKLLKEAFSKKVANSTRRQWKAKHGDPRLVPIRVQSWTKWSETAFAPKLSKLIALWQEYKP